MAMPDYFFFYPEQGTISGAVELSPANNFTSGNISGMNSSIYLSEASSSIEFDVSGQSYSTGYMKFHMQNAGSTNEPFLVLAGATTDLFRLVNINTSGGWKAEYWDGSAWTQLGSDITDSSTEAFSEADFHIKWVIDNSVGEFVVTKGGVTKINITATDTLTTSDTTIDSIRFEAILSMYVNGCAVDGADLQNINWDERLTTSIGGFNNLLKGAEADVDEELSNPVVSSFMMVNANGEGASLNMVSHDSLFSGHSVEGVYVVLTARGWGETAQLHLRGLARISSTDYVSGTSDQPIRSEGFKTRHFLFENDPSTASAWANLAAVEAAEFGFRVNTT